MKPSPTKTLCAILTGLMIAGSSQFARAESLEILAKSLKVADCITLVDGKSEAALVLDDQDFPVVRLAANLFADDIQRVSGRRLNVTNVPGLSAQAIIVGTLGKSALIQRLVAAGKLKEVDSIRDRWETTLMQIVDKPFVGVDRALVIVGSDRRGTAYGLMQLSRKIGVSPWNWWADVPVPHRDVVAFRLAAPQVDAPGVKYRGIFINDEDWGLYPWAARTFDPNFKNIGPKTYEKVFELMLRLRLNYLWPAMHGCSTEFGSVPENVALAGNYGIVAGSSHCEPMLYNNVKWRESQKGRWNYSLNRDTIHSTWEQYAKDRGAEEAVWTLGIRGIHDQGMQSPPDDMQGKIKLMEQVFRDQRELLDQNVTKEWGPVAQCFVPYKEVLPLHDAGLKVPDDVTLVWVDDNFGYIRRFSNPAERSRRGGAGVYWHLSYYGGPHSYTWINTTAPALMWSELHKAWENEARTLWVINVGDIKPMEIGIDYFSRLAWNPEAFPLASQRQFLSEFAAENFGEKTANGMTPLLMEFYRLGTIRKPELMERRWALSLTPEHAGQLADDYENLLQQEGSLARAVPEAARDAYTELIGFP
ncbi:MAG TPA: glycosyl hydrolase 115 family protein, partial [Candidatus Paceibacterota bacterium]|nr:glycosyl hydrolase 115 family protein [Candidatus Paceibacterota bacterium]